MATWEPTSSRSVRGMRGPTVTSWIVSSQQPQRQGNEEGSQQGVQDDQRQGQRTVAPVDGHPHQPHHRRGHREFQHHSCHHVGVVRKEQPSQAAGRRGQYQVERRKAGQQGQGAAEHRGDVPEAGFQPADEGHEGEDQRHIGHPQPRHRGKQHPRRQTAGGDQKHPLFQKTVAALQHRTIPPTGDPPGQNKVFPTKKARKLTRVSFLAFSDWRPL